MKARIRLTLDVDYETNGTPIADLKNHLWWCIEHMALGGGLTGDTGAEIEARDTAVEYLP